MATEEKANKQTEKKKKKPAACCSWLEARRCATQSELFGLRPLQEIPQSVERK